MEFSETTSIIIAQREGASLRTGHELVSIFLMDGLDILESKTPESSDKLLSLKEDIVSSDFLNIEGWLDDEDNIEVLNDTLNEMENLLADEGFYTEWQDGFIIYTDDSE